MKNSNDTRIDYRKYRDKKAVRLLVGAVFLIIFTAVGCVFSGNSIIAFAFGVIGGGVSFCQFTEWRCRCALRDIERQFADVMQMILSSVSVGMPVERAFGELSEGILDKRHDLKLIVPEVEIINRSVGMNYSFYALLENFAERSGSSDIINLSKALSISGTMGGNVAYIIRNALANLRIKIETDKEIEHTLALPKYNHRIITCMPFLLVIMLRFVSAEYINILYSTVVGQAVVAGATIIIVIAWLLGNSICKIRV